MKLKMSVLSVSPLPPPLRSAPCPFFSVFKTVVRTNRCWNRVSWPFKARHHRLNYCFFMRWAILWYSSVWLFITCFFRLVKRKIQCSLYCTISICVCIFQLQYISLKAVSQNEFFSPLQQHLHTTNLAVLFPSILEENYIVIIIVIELSPSPT